ncbi:adenylate kinase [Candidatus Phytoplasma phoenicium]|uniref:Adenylate kinase n=1 Tax=Candidatus Phytoplasma phoenicium TaxID=198422 RepID=A0A2S8NUZ3_9MOLU|nr:adenylate kinase [Candidatus Phytoplasma phoenicium]
MNIILIGPPATGKGTQSAILSKYFKIPHISIGDIFRKHLKEKTTLGKKINFYIEKGLLVPDEITNDMMIQSLLDKSNQNGFILDGFPRNLQQAVFLSKMFEQHDIILTKVIYFNSNEKLLKNRIIGRIICPKCGEIYHQENKLPQKNGFCDNDNIALIKRKDDSIETFNKRLSVYKQETLPLIEYYKNKILEIQVNDFNTSINDITKIILKQL